MSEPIKKDRCERHKDQDCIVSEPFQEWTFSHWCQEDMKDGPAPAKLIEHYVSQYQVRHDLVCSKCGKIEFVLGSNG